MCSVVDLKACPRCGESMEFVPSHFEDAPPPCGLREVPASWVCGCGECEESDGDTMGEPWEDE